MRKLKLSLIANERSRKATFMRRKRGMMQKLHKLTTLCGVQACAVICSPYQPVMESWPSKEVVKEVTSKFMEMPHTKKMMDHKTYLQEMIAKEEKKVDNLIRENKEAQIKQFMFDCVEGKMSKYRYDERDLHDLRCYIQKYIDFLTREIFKKNDVAAVAALDEFHDHIQYQNMNMNQNQQEAIQYYAPTSLYDQIQHGIYDMNLNQDMNLDSNSNMNLTSNQHQNQQQPSMEPRGQASIPFMEENHYNNHQVPNAGYVTTSYMPSTITTNGVYPSYINNNF